MAGSAPILVGQYMTGSRNPGGNSIGDPAFTLASQRGRVVVLHFRGPIVTRSLMNQIVPALAEAGYELHLPVAQSN